MYYLRCGSCSRALASVTLAYLFPRLDRLLYVTNILARHSLHARVVEVHHRRKIANPEHLVDRIMFDQSCVPQFVQLFKLACLFVQLYVLLFHPRELFTFVASFNFFELGQILHQAFRSVSLAFVKAKHGGQHDDKLRSLWFVPSFKKADVVVNNLWV